MPRQIFKKITRKNANVGKLLEKNFLIEKLLEKNINVKKLLLKNLQHFINARENFQIVKKFIKKWKYKNIARKKNRIVNEMQEKILRMSKNWKKKFQVEKCLVFLI